MVSRLFSDVYQYRKYPYFLPSLVSTLCYLSFFLCLEWCGWVSGTLLFAVIAFFTEKFIQPTIHCGSSRVPFGLACGVILVAFGYFYIVLSYHFGLAVHIVALFYTLIIPYSLFHTTTTMPHSARSDSAEECKLLINKIVEQERSGVEMRFCPTCLVDRANVSIHCSVKHKVHFLFTSTAHLYASLACCDLPMFSSI